MELHFMLRENNIEETKHTSACEAFEGRNAKY